MTLAIVVLAQAAYADFCQFQEGEDCDGRCLPDWGDLSEREQGAWGCAALRIVGLLGLEDT